ncbi:helix-turn-helix domain-containing protein [Patulibacter minatonensis]|uniref:helix-turn-helix domain-containing protein n=1 Tax=Patulibacter minatonensis TaxID=298163 RepID=UPI00047AEF91|nr:helix-turn-helix transcriptional regulator [Patulibacter minatonensis]
MPEIGVTLREARMRAGIDIAEVESRTKIRAKYLRALENEEWSLLPGTTFVKSFLRTYAEALGLDAKLLVEEYKFRHEPYEVGGAQNGGTQRGRRGGGRRAGGGGAFGPQKRTNLIPILVLLIVVAGAIYAVLELSKNEKEPTPPAATTTAERQPQRASDQAAADRAEARRKKRLVRLRIQAPSTESASVCVKDASGRTVLNEPELAARRRTKVVNSREFLLVTTAGARVFDGSRRLRVPADSRNVISYRIVKRKVTRLTGSRKPSCSS